PAGTRRGTTTPRADSCRTPPRASRRRTSPRGGRSRTERSGGRSRQLLHHGDLVALVVEPHLVHEELDEEHAAAAAALEVLGLPRVGEHADVESGSVVP